MRFIQRRRHYIERADGNGRPTGWGLFLKLTGLWHVRRKTESGIEEKEYKDRRSAKRFLGYPL